MVDSIEPEEAEWTPTRALGRAIVVCGLLLLAAVFTRRVDLIVLAAPVALGAALALWRRPHARPAVQLDMPEANFAEGGAISASLEVANDDPVRYDLVVVRVHTPLWLRLEVTDHPYVTSIPAGGGVGIGMSGHALRWGRHQLGPAYAYAIAADGMLVSPLSAAPAIPVKVHPITEPFAADDTMPRAGGLLGFHRSRRPGEGGELAGVRVFAPGDRLRRIDWRVSLRARQLHVVSTLSDRDAEIVLLLDLLHEAGRSGGVHGRRSVLDLTVRAAAGIGEHYLHRGDRVGFVEYGGFSRRLRAASGHRHFLTSLEWLLGVKARGGMNAPAPFSQAGNVVSPNAMVVVLTPLIDVRSAAMLARLARGGRIVVAVDTLPAEVLASLDDPSDGWSAGNDYTPIAASVWRMERANTIDLLRAHGIPVVAWTGAGSLDEVLAQVARIDLAPKMGR